MGIISSNLTIDAMKKQDTPYYKKILLLLSSKKGDISDWITIIGLPLLILGGLVSYFQFHDYVIRADLKFQFTYSDHFAYTIVNDTSRTAEEPYYGFEIIDLNESAPNYLLIPFEGDTFIKPKSRRGPNEKTISMLSKQNHEYYGLAMVTCRNCKSTKWYFLYINNSEPEKGFFVDFKNEGDYKNIIDKMNEAKSYNAIPIERRNNFNK